MPVCRKSTIFGCRPAHGLFFVARARLLLTYNLIKEIAMYYNSDPHFVPVLSPSEPIASQLRARWKDELDSLLPLLGHRNWLVVADEAYPLQTAPGITTLCTHCAFSEVLQDVVKVLDAAPHVRPRVLLDSEQRALQESFCPGIDACRRTIDECLGESGREYSPHEDIIRQLDEASRLYQVVILKTTQRMPYTSVFFKFDCGYWTAEQQTELDKRLRHNG